VTYAKKIDRNQPDIVKDLRAAGVSVQILSAVGKGCPDLLAGYNGVNYLLEIKMPDGSMTSDQRVWHTEWRGQVCVVYTSADALKVVKP
jgi:hypothetical protein